MEAWPVLKDDTRGDTSSYQSGDHVVTCNTCGSQYIGHEHSFECADCAYGFRKGRWTRQVSQRRTL
jgi:hypothetical protein